MDKELQEKALADLNSLQQGWRSFGELLNVLRRLIIVTARLELGECQRLRLGRYLRLRLRIRYRRLFTVYYLLIAY